MAVLPLSDVVQVIVNLAPKAVVRSGFDLALLIGDSDVLSLNNRVAVYSSLEAMAEDGFTAAMPEYQKAQIYFAQSSNPQKVAIGFWDSANESLAQAIAACRTANYEWYVVVPIGKTDTTGDLIPCTSADLLGAALTVEALTPNTVMVCANDTLATIQQFKALSYRRTLSIFSSNADIAVGIVGWAMGSNTLTANSAYTLKFKKIVGVSADALTEAQVSDAEAANGNVYINRGVDYDMFENGVMADGTWFDEIINLDMLANYMQRDVMDLLQKLAKAPQTEDGMQMLQNAFTPTLEKFVTSGFLAPGIWTAPTILDLETGDALERGYFIQHAAIDEQSTADRENRIAPPFYIALKLAGAIHSAVLQVDVNR